MYLLLNTAMPSPSACPTWMAYTKALNNEKFLNPPRMTSIIRQLSAYLALQVISVSMVDREKTLSQSFQTWSRATSVDPDQTAPRGVN